MTDENISVGGVNFSNISDSTIQTGDITTNITAGGDVVGRDKIVNNISNIVNQALSAAEEAAKAQELATKKLAEGVQDYLRRLQAIAEAESDTSGSPYKGLLAYRLSDADRFFGRDRAIAELLAQLQRSPLTILHAESGAGKSSLLQAGIANRLLGQGHLPVYLRPYNQSPALAIKRAFLPNLNDTPDLAEAPLHDFLRRVTGLLGQEAILILMLDQFEEIFTLLDDPARSKFVGELAECLEDESLSVRWVLSLRTEFFGNLANFRPRIRNPFENDYRLNRLIPEEAEIVIIEPTARQGIRFEPELVDTLLADLRDSDSGVVAPPQIQLVCSVLYNVLLERQKTNPDLPPTITLQMYQEEGQAKGILRGHLNRVLRQTLGPQEREAARQLLIALVSSDQRRIRRTRSNLAATVATYLTAAMSLDGLLDELVESRLLNVDEDEQTGEHSYELAHDYLVNEIEVDPELQARKAAQEMLSQEVSLWQRNPNLRIPVDKLAIIELQEQYLIKDKPAQTLLNSSRQARRMARLQQMGIIAGMIILPILAVLGVMYIVQIGPFSSPQITWSPVDGFDQTPVSDIAWGLDGTMYAGFGNAGQIARQSLGVEGWETFEIPGKFVINLVPDPVEPTVMYVLPDGAELQRSLDRGQTWEAIGQNIPFNNPINQLVISPDGTLFAGAINGGLYSSHDRGDSWVASEDTPLKTVNYMNWVDNRLLIGADDAGLWQWTQNERLKRLLDAEAGLIFAATSTSQGQFAGGSGGIWSIADQTRIGDETLTAIAVIPGTVDLVMAGTVNGDLVWWPTDAHDIAQVASGSDLGGADFISVIRLDPNQPDKVWVGTNKNLYMGNVEEWLVDK